jgi:MFS family permease
VRRLLALLSAIVLVDTSFYAAITPLLPYYADQHDLTKTSAGILTAAYPAGTMLGSLPAGWAAARVGAKQMLVFGLGLLVVSSVAFGLAQEVWLLDAARFAQGIGGAAVWTGGMGWLSQTAPPERRAEVLGTAFGAAIGGALLGPVVGAIARGIGPELTFSCVSGIALVLLVLALREQVERTQPDPEAGGLAAALRHPVILRGAWLIGVSALLFGLLDVLLPLKMGQLGAAGGVIAAVFLTSAAFEAGVSRVLGRRADRRGALGLARAGLLGTAALSLVASLPDSVALLAVVGVVAGPLVGLLWIPGLKQLGDGADAAGLEHSYAFAVMNLMWAGCGALGAGAGGALARSAGDFAAYACVAAVALATLLTTRSRAPIRS